jgi:hypothetical protein
MVNRITIGGKITFLVVSIVLASVLLVGFVASDLGKRTVAGRSRRFSDRPKPDCSLPVSCRTSATTWRP